MLTPKITTLTLFLIIQLKCPLAKVYPLMKRFLKSMFYRLLLPPLVKALSPLSQSQLNAEYWQLRADLAQKIPDSPSNYGYKIYSQCDEDGILQNIISRITLNEEMWTFLEIGAGDGVENNTALLVSNLEWSGIWVDPSDRLIQFARRLGPRKFLKIVTEKLSPMASLEQIGLMLQDIGVKSTDGVYSMGLLSIDIDSYDLDLLEALLLKLDPEILVLEYNASFPPPLLARVSYGDSENWQGDNFYGASLSEQARVLSQKYLLVGTSLSGVNSFWVKRRYSSEFSEYRISDLYNPPRYHLTQMKWGHPANSLKWLKLR